MMNDNILRNNSSFNIGYAKIVFGIMRRRKLSLAIVLSYSQIINTSKSWYLGEPYCYQD